MSDLVRFQLGLVAAHEAGNTADAKLFADAIRQIEAEPSIAGSFLRNARENIGAGIGGAVAGAKAGAVGGSLFGLPGAIGGSIVGAVGGGYVGATAQEMIDPMTEERQAALTLDRETNPVASLSGAMAPSLVTARPSIKNIFSAVTPIRQSTTPAARAAIIGNRVDMAMEAGVGAGFDIGQSLATGQPLDPSQIAFNAGAGMLFSRHNRLGEKIAGIQNSTVAPIPRQTVEPPIEPISPVEVEAIPLVVQGPVVQGPKFNHEPIPRQTAPVDSVTKVSEIFEPPVNQAPVNEAPLFTEVQGPTIQGPTIQGPVVKKPVIKNKPPIPLSTDVQNGVQGEPATGLLPGGSVVVPIETNAPVDPIAPPSPEILPEEAAPVIPLENPQTITPTPVVTRPAEAQVQAEITPTPEEPDDELLAALEEPASDGSVKGVPAETVTPQTQPPISQFAPNSSEVRRTPIAEIESELKPPRESASSSAEGTPSNQDTPRRVSYQWLGSDYTGTVTEITPSGKLAILPDGGDGRTKHIVAPDKVSDVAADDTRKRIVDEPSETTSLVEVEAIRRGVQRSGPLKSAEQIFEPQKGSKMNIRLSPEKNDSSIIAGLKAHSQEVKAWAKKEQNSGRMNSMPVDILGAQAYSALIDALVKALETGAALRQAVKTILNHQKSIQNLTKEEELIIKSSLLKQGMEYQKYEGERDAKFMVEMPRIAQELVAKGKNPSVADLIDALAKRFPDQEGYIRRNGEKIHENMIFAKDQLLDRKTDTQKEWGEWADSVATQTRKILHAKKMGAPEQRLKQAAYSLHANFQTGLGNRLRHLAQGNLTGNPSNALEKLADRLYGLKKGAEGVHAMAVDATMTLQVKELGNKLDAIQFELKPFFNKLTRTERAAFMERVGDHITDPTRDAELSRQPELKKAVEQYIVLREQLRNLMVNAGVNIGDAGERSMHRVFDRATVLANESEFVSQAKQAYQAKWKREIAEFKAEIATLNPDTDAVKIANLQAKADKLSKLNATDAARKYYINIQTDELGITSNGNDLFSEPTHNPSSFKKREFGDEADQLLGKFYIRNADAILRREISNAVRAAGVAKIIAKTSKNGNVDPIGGWKDLRQELINEGNPDMIPLVATLIKEQFNLGGEDNPRMRKVLELAHLHGQLSYLARAPLSSLGEIALPAIRTGNLSDIGKMLVSTVKGMRRELKGATPTEERIISNAIGLSTDGMNGILSANRFLDTYSFTGKAGELVTSFHGKTGLNSLTQSVAASSSKVATSFLKTNLELRQANGKFKSLAGGALNELGIETKDIPAMLKFLEEYDAKASTQEKLQHVLQDTPEAVKYRNALHLFNTSGGSLTTSRGNRPRWANTPLGSMYYAFQSFLFTFQDQVLSRHVRRIRIANKGSMKVDGVEEALAPEERMKLYMETAKGLAVIAAAQYAIQMIRETLFADPARMKEEGKTAAEKAKARAYSIATRSSLIGGYDILFNMATGARHGADPSTRLLGPSLGAGLSLIGQVIRDGGAKDSPNTNTYERQTARKTFDFFAKTPVNALAATLPGAKLPFALIQSASHPGVREKFVKSVAGEAKKPQEKGPMSRASRL